jgi:hypothetical protein
MVHFASSCPSKLDEKPNTSKRQSSKKQDNVTRSKNITCYNCREKGHIGKNCPNDNASKPILFNDHYLLRNVRNGTIIVKVVSSHKLRTKAIWVPKSLVTTFKDPTRFDYHKMLE